MKMVKISVEFTGYADVWIPEDSILIQEGDDVDRELRIAGENEVEHLICNAGLDFVRLEIQDSSIESER